MYQVRGCGFQVFLTSMSRHSTPEFLRHRQQRIRQLLLESKVDAFITQHAPHIRYAGLFTGSTGLAVLTPDKNWVLVDPRYTTQARGEVRGFTIRECRSSLEEGCGTLLPEIGCQRVCYEPRKTTVDSLERLRRFSPRRLEWTAADGFLDHLRAVKDAHELEIMRRAAKLTWETCDDIIRLLVPGVCEKDVAAELEYRLIRKGATKTSFETIIASGWRSALPHGSATQNRLRRNEFVVVDFGIVLDGYCSDMTRTFYLGVPGAREKRIYSAVREALEATEAFLKEGVNTSEADNVARRSLGRHRLASKFSHSTGHGVGLEIHEFPSLHHKHPVRLKSDMVVTVEPGVYVPRWGGVRIEDMVAITPGGCEILTGYTHDLISV